MREKMIAIARRLRTRAADQLDSTPATWRDILNCIADEIEQELEEPPAASNNPIKARETIE